MPSKLDLTGQKFGRLAVIGKEASRNGKTYWLCRCDCGNEKGIATTNLRRGATQSCGCFNSEQSTKTHSKDLTGKRFGKLTAIRRIESKRREKLIWECLCDCGNITQATTNKLTSGEKKHCLSCRPKGENHHGWKGGKRKTKSGYVVMHAPEHPFKSVSQRYVFEHRLVMEKQLKTLRLRKSADSLE